MCLGNRLANLGLCDEDMLSWPRPSTPAMLSVRPSLKYFLAQEYIDDMLISFGMDLGIGMFKCPKTLHQRVTEFYTHFGFWLFLYKNMTIPTPTYITSLGTRQD